ncbi:MAG TPA: hypothetical protein VFN57_08105 [Thermomicrobiaceae bacterium]|nr:hypothetical protein [Thermomicrobiaceae bacterium]
MLDEPSDTLLPVCPPKTDVWLGVVAALDWVRLLVVAVLALALVAVEAAVAVGVEAVWAAARIEKTAVPTTLAVITQRRTARVRSTSRPRCTSALPVRHWGRTDACRAVLAAVEAVVFSDVMLVARSLANP